MANIVVTPMDEDDKRNAKLVGKNSNFAMLWEPYSASYNNLVKRMEAANIDRELLNKVIKAAITLDRLNIDVE